MQDSCYPSLRGSRRTAFATLLFVAAAGLTPVASLAGEVESWNEVSYTVFDTGRFNWQVSAGFRIRDRFGQLYDRRTGGLLAVAIGRGVSIAGGYLFRNRDFDEFGYRWDYRLIADIEYPLLKSGNLRLGGRTLYERHIGRPDLADFNRYRQQFELEPSATGLSPWLYQDFTFLRQGFVRSRSRAGFQWKTRSGYTFAVGYQFETVNLPPDPSWRPRHAIVTSLEIHKPLWRSERYTPARPAGP